MSEHTETKTVDGSHTWTDTSEHTAPQETVCRLRILYHVNLERIGEMSSPDTFLQANPWLLVGRNTPIFSTHNGHAATLEDPTISRKQFRIRWLDEHNVFEIEPMLGARLELNILTPSQEGVFCQPAPVLERIQAVPGSCLCVGNRLMLALEHVRIYHSADDDRMGLMGESDCMWTLRQSIREIASFRRPVLVLGSTGSGKELVSQAIHRVGHRQTKPFVVANCAALPDNIVESLLFGHRKGAFTGADHNHGGLFRAADQGTLFLDEVGELSMTLQPKLLRVIQDGEVRPVGAQDSFQVDVRLIAATNRNPEQEIVAGRLREDLYHRLATYLIKIPSLNERRLDIPELFVSFLKRFGAENPQSQWLWHDNKHWKKTIPLDWFIELLCFDWTGNVRQLENVAARVIQCNLDGPLFRPPSLPYMRRLESSPAVEWVSPLMDSEDEEHLSEHFQRTCEILDLAHKTVRKLLDMPTIEDIWCKAEGHSTVESEIESEVELAVIEEHLKQAVSLRLVGLLEANDFSQRRVCKHLDISPSTLIKIMQRFEIPRPSDLTLAMIDHAIAECGDDLDQVAKRLRVSPQGLRRQFTLLNLKRS